MFDKARSLTLEIDNIPYLWLGRVSDYGAPKGAVIEKARRRKPLAKSMDLPPSREFALFFPDRAHPKLAAACRDAGWKWQTLGMAARVARVTLSSTDEDTLSAIKMTNGMIVIRDTVALVRPFLTREEYKRSAPPRPFNLRPRLPIGTEQEARAKWTELGGSEPTSCIQHGNIWTIKADRPPGPCIEAQVSLSGTCYKCGLPGHVAAQCHNQAKFRCENCGTQGHTASVCRILPPEPPSAGALDNALADIRKTMLHPAVPAKIIKMFNEMVDYARKPMLLSRTEFPTLTATSAAAAASAPTVQRQTQATPPASPISSPPAGLNIADVSMAGDSSIDRSTQKRTQHPENPSVSLSSPPSARPRSLSPSSPTLSPGGISSNARVSTAAPAAPADV